MDDSALERYEKLKKEYARKKRKLEKCQRFASARAHVKRKIKEQMTTSSLELKHEEKQSDSDVSELLEYTVISGHQESQHGDLHVNRVTDITLGNQYDECLNTSMKEALSGSCNGMDGAFTDSFADVDGTVTDSCNSKSMSQDILSQDIFMTQMSTQDQKHEKSKISCSLFNNNLQSCSFTPNISKYKTKNIVTRGKSSPIIKESGSQQVSRQEWIKSNLKKLDTKNIETKRINNSSKSCDRSKTFVGSERIFDKPNSGTKVEQKSNHLNMTTGKELKQVLKEKHETVKSNFEKKTGCVESDKAQLKDKLAKTLKGSEDEQKSYYMNIIKDVAIQQKVNKINSKQDMFIYSSNIVGSDRSTFISSQGSSSIFSDSTEGSATLECDDFLKRKPRVRKRRSLGAIRQSARLADLSSQENSNQSSTDVDVASPLYLCASVPKLKKRVIVSSMFQCLVDEVKRKNKFEEFNLPLDYIEKFSTDDSEMSINGNVELYRNKQQDRKNDKVCTAIHSSHIHSIELDKTHIKNRPVENTEFNRRNGATTNINSATLDSDGTIPDSSDSTPNINSSTPNTINGTTNSCDTTSIRNVSACYQEQVKAYIHQHQSKTKTVEDISATTNHTSTTPHSSGSTPDTNASVYCIRLDNPDTNVHQHQSKTVTTDIISPTLFDSQSNSQKIFNFDIAKENIDSADLKAELSTVLNNDENDNNSISVIPSNADKHEHDISSNSFELLGISQSSVTLADKSDCISCQDSIHKKVPDSNNSGLPLICDDTIKFIGDDGRCYTCETNIELAGHVGGPGGDGSEVQLLKQTDSFQVPRGEQLLSMVAMEIVTDGAHCDYIACLCTTSLKLYTEVDRQWTCIWTQKLNKSIKKNSGCRLYSMCCTQDVSFVYQQIKSDSTNLTLYTYMDEDMKQALIDDIWARSVYVCLLQGYHLIVGHYIDERTYVTKYSLDVLTTNWTQVEMDSTEEHVTSLLTVQGLDAAVVGLSIAGKVLIWNYEHGFLLSTVDISDVCPCAALCPAVYSDQGFLFLLMLNKKKCLEPGTIVVINPHIGSSEILTSISALDRAWTGCTQASVMDQGLLLARETCGRVHIWDVFTGGCLATVDDVTVTSYTSSSHFLAIAHKQCVHVYGVEG